MGGETITLSDHNEGIEGVVPVKDILRFKNGPVVWNATKPKTVTNKSRSSSKKPRKNQPKRIKKHCKFIMPGDVEFTTDGKTIVTPHVICSRIVNGKKVKNFGNVICDTCGKCFCCVYEIEGMKKCVMKRNCFEKHKTMKGSLCEDATFTHLSKITPT